MECPTEAKRRPHHPLPNARARNRGTSPGMSPARKADRSAAIGTHDLIATKEPPVAEIATRCARPLVAGAVGFAGAMKLTYQLDHRRTARRPHRWLRKAR